MVARLEPYRPRCRAGIGTLAVVDQVAGRFTGPEPSAPLWILLLAYYMNGVHFGQGPEWMPMDLRGGKLHLRAVTVVNPGDLSSALQSGRPRKGRRGSAHEAVPPSTRTKCCWNAGRPPLDGHCDFLNGASASIRQHGPPCKRGANLTASS